MKRISSQGFLIIYSGVRARSGNLPSIRHQNSVVLECFLVLGSAEKLDEERVLGQ